MRRQTPVRFEGSRGDLLAGVLHPAAGEEGRSVVLTHCFTCSKDYKILVRLSRFLSQKGFTVFRFDFAGLGDSQGEFAHTTLSTDVQDLRAAVSWLAGQGLSVEALVGHSMGGTAAILAARTLREVRSVAVMGTSWNVQGITRILRQQDWQEILSRGQTTVAVVGRPYPISREFVEDLQRYSLLKVVGEWDKRFLVVHGSEDRTVPLEKARKLFEAAAEPKQLVIIPGADHLFSRPEDAEAVAGELGRWLQEGNSS